MAEANSKKIYYSMGEVSEMMDVNPSLIRFWEQKFDMLKPHKNKKGNRMFTPADVDTLKLIYHLVKERGMTLDGAARKLKAGTEGVERDMELMERLQSVRALLLEIRNELREEGEVVAEEPVSEADAVPSEPERSEAEPLPEVPIELIVETQEEEPAQEQEREEAGAEAPEADAFAGAFSDEGERSQAETAWEAEAGEWADDRSDAEQEALEREIEAAAAREAYGPADGERYAGEEPEASENESQDGSRETEAEADGGEDDEEDDEEDDGYEDGGDEEAEEEDEGEEDVEAGEEMDEGVMDEGMPEVVIYRPSGDEPSGREAGETESAGAADEAGASGPEIPGETGAAESEDPEAEEPAPDAAEESSPEGGEEPSAGGEPRPVRQRPRKKEDDSQGKLGPMIVEQTLF